MLRMLGGATMPPIDPPQLEDGVVVVRPLEAGDIEAVVEACQDPEIPRWTVVPSPYERRDAEQWVRTTRQWFEEGTGAHMAVADAATGALAGACGVSVEWPDLAGEVGYWVAAPHRGKGIATRATRLVCRWAFDELGLHRLSLRAAAANEGSNAVARKVGFVHEGTLRQGGIQGHTGDRADPRVDMNVYGLLPGELR
jgi:RimJ/RimL family protein N-acetyltransferase